VGKRTPSRSEVFRSASGAKRRLLAQRWSKEMERYLALAPGKAKWTLRRR